MGKRSREKKEERLQSSERGALIIKHTNLERAYFLFIEWGIYLALFTPLIFLKGYFFPFVSLKTIFFRMVVDVIFIAYILLVISNRRYLPRINGLTISLAVFFGALILTSFTGVNFARSFWSTFERMTGLLTFFHLFAFFIVLSGVFKERKHWQRIITVSVLVGVLLSLYVLFKDNLSARGGGTIGNVSFLAAYLLFDIFFAIIFLFARAGLWRIFYGVSLIVMVLTLFLSPELPRGAIGAFFLGIFLLGLCYMVFSKKKLLKRAAPLVLVLALLVGAAISQTNLFKEKIMDIKELPGEARELVWQIGLKSWGEKPWLGWGIENFNVPFAKYFNPKLPLTQDVWYDRVHNIILDTAVSSGIFGLTSYLSIFAVAILGLVRISSKVVERRNIFLPLGMVALLVVYFAQNMWVFDMISTYMMFFLSLAFVYFLLSPEGQVAPPAFSSRKNYFYLFFGPAMVVVAISAIYFGNIQPARASRYVVQGLTLPPEKSILIYQKAIKISPISIFEAPEQFSRKITSYTFDEKVNKKTLEEGFLLSAKEMEGAIAKNPADFRLYLILARHYNNLFNLTKNQDALWRAEKILTEALPLSPGNQQTYWTLAQTKIFQGKGEEAVQLMQKTIDLEPQYSSSHWYLAMTYKSIGEYDLALKKVKDAEDAGYDLKGNLEDLKKVIDIYQNLPDRNNVDLLALYQIAIEKSPEDARFWGGMAVTQANLGQFKEARESAKKAMELNPEFTKELERFLDSLPR